MITTRESRCRICGKAIRYLSRRCVWVHVAPGANHGPIPEETT